jgi:thiol-disulfide isomerase/thioredoxin
MNDNKSNLVKTIAIAVAVFAIIGVGGFALNSNMNDNKAKQDKETADKAMMKKETDAKIEKEKMDKMAKDSTMKKESAEEMMAKNGDYKPYDPSEISHAKDGHHVVLFFNASWCPTCQATVKNINSNLDKIDMNLHILSVDYDSNVALRQKYGVTMQHTFVEVDANGSQIKKVSGLSDVAAINNFVK